MRYSKYLTIAALICLAALALQQEAKADLTAAEIVADFNSRNSNRGMHIQYMPVNGEGRLASTTGAAGLPSVDAYDLSTASSGGYFSSFCVEANTNISTGQYYGVLNYANGRTQNSSGHALSVGAAYLYQQFAAGSLSDYSYSGDRAASAASLQQAMYFLTGQTTTANWSNNTFLGNLLTINGNQAYWLSTYDPGQRYAEIGDFSVFVVQLTTAAGGDAQDFVYVAKSSFGGAVGDVPEPASVLLWLVGGVSALGAGYAKKRRKKVALA